MSISFQNRLLLLAADVVVDDGICLIDEMGVPVVD
jgi:hypothetical protein